MNDLPYLSAPFLALFLAMIILGIGLAHLIPWLAERRAVDRRRRQLAAAVAGVAERHPCGFCDDLSEMGDPEDCACRRPCSKPWCTVLRRDLAALHAAADEFGRPDHG